MENGSERRVYPRLRYTWQMYYEQPGLAGCQSGHMVDLSEVSARFSVPAETQMERGMRLDLRLSHPYVTDEYGYQVRSVSRAGQVLRVDRPNGHGLEVAVVLDRPLHYGMAGQTLPG